MLDGYYPGVRHAIVAGVQTARQEARRLGFSQLQIGTNTTPLFGPAAGFYSELVQLGGQALIDGLDHIGLQFGIMTDGYVPKPAFEVFKQLIEKGRTDAAMN